MKKKQGERFQNNSSYRNVLTQIMGPKGWFWDEARPSSVYSHCLLAFRHSPLPHIQVPITLLTHDTKKKLQTQAAITWNCLKLVLLIRKALAIPKVEKEWFTSSFETCFFLDTLAVMQHLLLNYYSRINGDGIYFKSVSFQYSLQVHEVTVLPNFQCLFGKSYRVHLPLLKLLLISFLVGSN